MIFCYLYSHGYLHKAEYSGQAEMIREAVWIDCQDITYEENHIIEGILAIELPTREEMREIEMSSRTYRQNGVFYMTATVISNSDSSAPSSDAITFMVTADKVITLRYSAPRSFEVFAGRLIRSPGEYATPAYLFMGLMEIIVYRSADVLEYLTEKIDGLSHKIFDFQNGKHQNRPTPNLQLLLSQIGQNGDLASKLHESLVSVNRVLKFFSHQVRDDELALRLSTLEADVVALREYEVFLSSKLSFMLDATLGKINIEQNTIIKIFSVASVIFLPPTLIASIYGMNFHKLPELGWEFGYPYAIGLMVLSAVLPYLYFKKKKWL